MEQENAIKQIAGAVRMLTCMIDIPLYEDILDLKDRQQAVEWFRHHLDMMHKNMFQIEVE